MRSNCLIFALNRWFKEGGYLIIRKSHYGWWPHFIWAKSINGIETEQYVPMTPKEGKVCPPPLFKGYVKRSDRD